MSSFDVRLRDLVLKLFDINALKFGDFKMKVGINSPVYFDLRVIISYLDMLESYSLLLHEFAQADFECDHICGVPYSALPIATLISVRKNKSMLIRRREAQVYGTDTLIDGRFSPGDTCIVVDDVVSSGSTIIETVRALESVGLKVTTAVVLLDRQQGGVKNIKSHGINIKRMITMSGVMRILSDAGKIDVYQVNLVEKHIKNCQIYPDGAFRTSPSFSGPNRLTTSFLERSKVAKNPTSARLLMLMTEKRTNLCVAADLTTAEQVLALARQVGPYVCIFKTHVDIMTDFTMEFVEELKLVAEKYNFLIMEDRKFCDDEHVVRMQCADGVHRIASWADIVTADAVSGNGVLQGLKAAVRTALDTRSCVLVAEMNTDRNLTQAAYQSSSIRMAETQEDFVSGIVSQTANTMTSLGLLQLTPGVKLTASDGDRYGQQYTTPEDAILVRGGDIAIVGRGITEAANRAAEAVVFRDKLWAAYEKRVN